MAQNSTDFIPSQFWKTEFEVSLTGLKSRRWHNWFLLAALGEIIFFVSSSFKITYIPWLMAPS
jgi:hypothetical protein